MFFNEVIMKKMKFILSFLLSLGFLFPSFACKQSAPLPPSSGEINSSISSEETEDSSDEIDVPSTLPPSNSSSTPPSNDGTNKPNPPSNSAGSTNTPEKLSTAEYIRCTGNNVNLRAGAGTDFSVVGSAEKGTMYAVIGKIGNWYKTYYKNKIAYIYAEYVSVFTLKKTTDESVEKVVSEGYKTIGVPYVYGAVRLHDGKGNFLKGFTAQKFDCSSLVQYVFYQGAKKKLDVTTRTQIKQGRFVAKSDLQRGDCLFFTNEDRQYNTGIERVGHVAIYLGNDYILHTASDYARIEKISAKRWSFYIEARRFL